MYIYIYTYTHICTILSILKPAADSRLGVGTSPPGGHWEYISTSTATPFLILWEFDCNFTNHNFRKTFESQKKYQLPPLWQYIDLANSRVLLKVQLVKS